MHDFTTIVVAFGTSLSATIAVALLLRIGGGKPNRAVCETSPRCRCRSEVTYSELAG